MGVLSSAKKRVRDAVPGLKTESQKQYESMVELAEQQGVPVGYFRCEQCSTQKPIQKIGGPGLTKTDEGNVVCLALCKSCSVKYPDD